ncbi:lysophospholipid acyltransferase family protein [Sinomonas sp. ASV486]|uniref:lysophospholipid acyltransferase family protein n=1 Tax=Sinomonas sp. ASV486 TaxID=3051170 RepID=UPI0027DBB596|nr:lysophospholipid acyltransferase family protein [Sinomonas sp. ASV486]MDQ4492197.1 lysophospholipid acyltransferase family protein [Sinomonas sp. ASV486]
MSYLKRLLLLVLKAWVDRRVIGVLGEKPPAAPFIVTANHTSYFDHVVLAWWLLCNGLPYPKFLSKSELFDSPLSAWFNRRGGGIPVERGGADMDAFEAARKVLADGGVLVMYAEGTRSRDGWLRAPRRGLATLAAEAGVPVVPVGLFGVNEVLPVGSRWPRRRRRIAVNVASPLAPPEAGRAAGQEFILRVFARIAGQTGQWPAFVAPEFAPAPGPARRGSRAAAAHALVERAFRAQSGEAEELFRRALLVTRGVRCDYADLERGRAAGQMAGFTRNPFAQLAWALRSRRLIWRSVRRLPGNALAWHVWASLMERLPGWLGGDRVAAAMGHRVAVSLTQDHRNALHTALVFRDAGRPQEAARWLELFLQLDRAAADRLRIQRGRELLAELRGGEVPSAAAR